MRRWHALFASFLATVSFGCAMSSEPIGDLSPDVDITEWEVIWIHEESFDLDAIVAVVRVASLEDARFHINWLEIDGDEVLLRESTGTLRVLNGALFLNVRNEEEGTMAQPRYYWARVEKDGHLVRAWVPNYDRLEELVTEGILPGQVDRFEYEITLGELKSEHELLLSSEALPVIPVVFRRIGG